MRILVVGAGAVGSLIGALLAHAGHEMTLVRLDAPVRDKAPLTLVRPDGTKLDLTARLLPAVPLPDDPGGDPELIVIGVKMFAVADAVASCAAWPDVPVVTIQNGIGAEEAVVAARPGGRSIAASLTAAVEVDRDGTIRQLARGGIAFAPVSGATSPVATALAADLRFAGMRTAVLEDAASMKWSKMLANLIGNATSAILDLDPSRIYGRPDLFALERAQMLETLAAMRSIGCRPIALPGAPIPWVARAYRVPALVGRPILSRVVGGARGGKSPSLRLAVSRGESPTEVAWLNGAVARTASAHGFDAAVNARLAALVDDVAADPDRAAWFRGRPDRLLGEVASGRSA